MVEGCQGQTLSIRTLGKGTMRAALHYTTAAVLLTIYGGQVCPFIETIPVMILGAIISSWLLLFFLVRLFFAGLLVGKARPLYQPRRQFFLELSVFGAAGLAMAFYNLAAYGFPLDSGLKLFAGCLTLGFCAAADLALARNYRITANLGKEAAGSDPDPHFFSLSRKMALVAMFMVVGAAIVLLLLILQDLAWIKALPADAYLYPATREIITEFALVLGVLVAYTSLLIASCGRNQKLLLSRQTSALKEVADGRLNGHVPVTTNDEFGVIAAHTNRMIATLRERTEQLRITQDVTMLSLASLAETRDTEPGQHSILTQHYVRALAEDLKEDSDLTPLLDENAIATIFRSRPLNETGQADSPDLETEQLNPKSSK